MKVVHINKKKAQEEKISEDFIQRLRAKWYEREKKKVTGNKPSIITNKP